MSVDPFLFSNPSNDGHDGPSDRPGPTFEAPYGAPPEADEPIRTLLWTAATCRPLKEVAALVSLLKRTGEVPSPGDEALRAAAVARPVDEVMQLVALLNIPPHEVGEADTTLRAAAVGRPIEDVAQLVSILGTADGHARPPVPVEKPSNGRGANDAAVEAGPRPSEPASPATSAPSFIAAFGGPTGAGPGSRTGSASLRSVLRWPAAAALIVCGVIHLPTDVTHLRSAGYADALSLAVSVLCLVFGCWLAVQDRPWIWAACVATALGVVAVYSLSGFASFDLLGNSLGETLVWANVVAVGCAALTALLAGSVLMRRQKTADATSDT